MKMSYPDQPGRASLLNGAPDELSLLGETMIARRNFANQSLLNSLAAQMVTPTSQQLSSQLGGLNSLQSSLRSLRNPLITDSLLGSRSLNSNAAILSNLAALNPQVLGPYGAVDQSLLSQQLLDSRLKGRPLGIVSRSSSAPSRESPPTLPTDADNAELVQRALSGANEEALDILGVKSLMRRQNKTPYFDASTLSDPPPVTIASRRSRGGVTEPFPHKLYRMLIDVEKMGMGDVISFLPHGRAFIIHKPEKFARDIMGNYFKQSRVSSFQRQLNLYGFTRLNTGPDAGAYYHELFLRGRPALSAHICRVGVPKSVPRRRGVKAHDATVDPDFYAMPPVRGSLR